MIVTQKTFYISMNGIEFATIKDCIDHENQLRLDNLKEIFDTGSRIFQLAPDNTIYCYIAHKDDIKLFNQWAEYNRLFDDSKPTDSPIYFNDDTPIETWLFVKQGPNGYFHYNAQQSIDFQISQMNALKTELNTTIQSPCQSDTEHDRIKPFEVLEEDIYSY